MEAAVSGHSYGGSAASRKSASPILPLGRLELGGELLLITADRDLSGEELRFTDVALFPLHVRASVARWLELSGQTTLLVKHSESMDEPVWQGGELGVRIPFGSVFAGTVRLGGGPLMFHSGKFWAEESSLMAKLPANEWMRFELRAGYLLTALRYSGAATGSSSIHEVMGHAEVQFGAEGGGAWLGIDYYVPVASTTRAEALDPNVRLNLELGCVLSPEHTDWDLYVSYAVVDRGNVERPGTTLPILNGGFDQRQWLLGVQYHFDIGEDVQRRRQRRGAYE